MHPRCFLLTLSAFAVVCAGIARADDASDSGRARAALARGDIRPLAGILAAVEQRYEGRVIDTELECRPGPMDLRVQAAAADRAHFQGAGGRRDRRADRHRRPRARAPMTAARASVHAPREQADARAGGGGQSPRSPPSCAPRSPPPASPSIARRTARRACSSARPSRMTRWCSISACPGSMGCRCCAPGGRRGAPCRC